MTSGASYSVQENSPALWRGKYPNIRIDGHKYDRGHTAVLSGPLARTGASRLAAGGALRAGSGLVTLFSPPSALLVNASHLTAIMIQSFADLDDLKRLLGDHRINCVIAGPALGIGESVCKTVETLLSFDKRVVLDADALTSFKNTPERLFAAIRKNRAPVVLTPHTGEFESLFSMGDLKTAVARLDAVSQASRISGACVILKGAGSLVALYDDRIKKVQLSRCLSAPPWLATAGSGDVLAGIIGGLLAQSMPVFEAASCGVWLHGEAANHCGPAMISEDLDGGLKAAMNKFLSERM